MFRESKLQYAYDVGPVLNTERSPLATCQLDNEGPTLLICAHLRL